MVRRRLTALLLRMIVPYQPSLAGDFARLNRRWLEEYFTVEPLDEAYLGDPEGHIIQPGGEIFFALEGDRVIGCCAAKLQDNGDFELAKLAVDPSAQGRGLGRILAREVIEFALGRGAQKVVLVSNSRLVPAIKLYESLGFEHKPFPMPRPYIDADVYMELSLSSLKNRNERTAAG